MLVWISIPGKLKKRFPIRKAYIKPILLVTNGNNLLKEKK